MHVLYVVCDGTPQYISMYTDPYAQPAPPPGYQYNGDQPSEGNPCLGYALLAVVAFLVIGLIIWLVGYMERRRRAHPPPEFEQQGFRDRDMTRHFEYLSGMHRW